MIDIQNFKGFYFITDHNLSLNGNVKDVEQALKAGAKIVQFREKHRTQNEYVNELIAIQELCQQYSAKLIINDSVDLALEINADGVHLGQGDDDLVEARKLLGKNKIIGATANFLITALEAQNEGADYLGIGHIYLTSTKEKDYPPLGIKALREIKEKVRIPIVAIGGIHYNNAKAVVDTGVDMIAAVSASLKKGMVEDNLRQFIQLFNRK